MGNLKRGQKSMESWMNGEGIWYKKQMNMLSRRHHEKECCQNQWINRERGKTEVKERTQLQQNQMRDKRTVLFFFLSAQIHNQRLWRQLKRLWRQLLLSYLLMLFFSLWFLLLQGVNDKSQGFLLSFFFLKQFFHSSCCFSRGKTLSLTKCPASMAIRWQCSNNQVMRDQHELLLSKRRKQRMQ